MTRHDVPAEEVARRWLEGETIAVLANSYQADTGTIQDRLKKARAQFPELPWNDRTPPQTARQPSPTRAFLSMKDGAEGSPAVRSGHVVRSRGLRSR